MVGTIFSLSFVYLLLDIVCSYFANGEFANQWAVYMHGGIEQATQVALEHGFRNMGPIGMLKDIYLFTHRAVPRRQRRSALFRNMFLQSDRRVDLVVQQVIRKRVKREISLEFNDKRWPEQWLLHNRDPRRAGHDMNILPAWKKGITGKNVVVTILDDGIEYTHRELRKNYDKNASHDYNDNDPDPMPRWSLEHGGYSQNRHGTRCAAQVAAEANNSFCIVGVAYNARIGGIRMLDGDVTDAVEASSLTHRRDYIDIYSSSWGPDDDGITVDGPGNLTIKALKEGIIYGRNGKGSIFVWASGNGGDKDDCNCDGYTNSIYTVSAGAATSYGAKPWYLEQCSSTLISTYGGGDRISDGRVVTADLNGGCTSRHTGTSVAAPFIAGFIALALEVNPNLTWRDVQHVLVNSGNVKNLDPSSVKTNGANKKYSPIFGFGIVDGGALVDLAAKWSLVSEQHVCKTPLAKSSLLIDSREKLIIDITTKACKGTRNYVRYLEHMHINVSLAHSSRGAVSIYLVSPMGTRSRVLGRRKVDTKRGSFKNWAFLSIHFWGENPHGKWRLEIESAHGNGLIEEWQLIMYGSEYLPGVPYQNANNRPFVPGLKGVRCHSECLEGCTGPGAHECIRCKNYKIGNKNKVSVSGLC